MSLIPYRRSNNSISNYFDPFRMMADMEREFFGSQRTGSFSTDIRETDTEYVLEADLPGFNKEDIHVDISQDTLTISAENKTYDGSAVIILSMRIKKRKAAISAANVPMAAMSGASAWTAWIRMRSKRPSQTACLPSPCRNGSNPRSSADGWKSKANKREPDIARLSPVPAACRKTKKSGCAVS